MSPKVPEAYLEARRREILDAAATCFAKKGFHNTTMQDIYQVSGLSPGAVYNYFASKEDIVVAAIQETSDWLASSLASVIAENPDNSIVSTIRFWLAAITRGDIGEGISVQLEFYAEAVRNRPIRTAMLGTHNATHEKLLELIEQSQRTGVVNPELDPLSIARAIMGMIFGIMIHKSLEPDVDLEAYGQVVEAIFTGDFSYPPETAVDR